MTFSIVEKRGHLSRLAYVLLGTKCYHIGVYMHSYYSKLLVHLSLNDLFPTGKQVYMLSIFVPTLVVPILSISSSFLKDQHIKTLFTPNSDNNNRKKTRPPKIISKLNIEDNSDNFNIEVRGCFDVDGVVLLKWSIGSASASHQCGPGSIPGWGSDPGAVSEKGLTSLV